MAMKRKIYSLAVVAILIALFAVAGGCRAQSDGLVSGCIVFQPRTVNDDDIAAILVNMSMEEKVGQVVLAGFTGLDINHSADLPDLIDRYKVGNFILFTRNCYSTAQIAELTAGIQTTLTQAGRPPAIIAIDQEGGVVTRIFKGATIWPGVMALGAVNSEDVCYKVANASGSELINLGINMNLAPVVDVNNNPNNPVIGVRSFGDNPTRVGELAAAYIRGLQDAGIIATAKHFPGHGNTDIDSHLALPIINSSLSDMDKVELVPFKQAIANKVAAIMTAHIIVPVLDDNNLPATLSSQIINGVLRQKLNFDGLVVTDAMEMKAIADNYGDDAAVKSLNAGADLVCLANDGQRIRAMIDKIKMAIVSGDLPMSRLDEAAGRVIKTKMMYGIIGDDNKYMPIAFDAKLVGSAQHKKLAYETSCKSLTLLRDKMKILPLNSGKKILAIGSNDIALTGAEDSVKIAHSFPNVMAEKFAAQPLMVGLQPSAAEISRAVDMARNYDVVLIGSYNALRNTAQLDLIDKVLQVNPAVVVVMLRNPYDETKLASVPGVICTYEYSLLSMQSLPSALAGDVEWQGVLPVSLSH